MFWRISIENLKINENTQKYVAYSSPRGESSIFQGVWDMCGASKSWDKIVTECDILVVVKTKEQVAMLA